MNRCRHPASKIRVHIVQSAWTEIDVQGEVLDEGFEVGLQCVSAACSCGARWEGTGALFGAPVWAWTALRRALAAWERPEPRPIPRPSAAKRRRR